MFCSDFFAYSIFYILLLKVLVTSVLFCLFNQLNVFTILSYMGFFCLPFVAHVRRRTHKLDFMSQIN